MLGLLGVWVSVFMLRMSFAMEPSGPVCSQFHYEEKLLERVIRNEFALKDTLDKIKETNEKVEEMLKHIETENAKLNHAKHALEDKKITIDDKVTAFIDNGAQNVSVTVAEMKAAVQSLVEKTAQDLDVMKEIQKTAVQALVEKTAKALDVMKENSLVPLVMFHARHSTGQHTYTTKQTVVYSSVLVNDGGGYDTATGNFTASVSGVYLFTVQFCPYANKWAWPEIVHAGTSLQRSGHKGDSNTVCVSMQAIAKVAMGDKVWVRTTSTSEIDYYEPHRFNSFAGLLIRL